MAPDHAQPARPLALPVARPAAARPASTQGLAIEERLHVLQGGVGNRAVNQVVRRSADDLFSSPSSSTSDDEATCEPIAVGDDNGKAVYSMSWTELKRAISEHEGYISGQTSTTPEVVKRERRLDDLRAARDKLASKTRERRRKRKRRRKDKEMPERPQSLDRSLRTDKEFSHQLAHELDLIVAYLAANPSREERALLESALPAIERAVGLEEATVETERRGRRLQRAMTPTGGSEASQFKEMLARVQSMAPDPSNPDVYLLHFDGEVLPVSKDEAQNLRAKVTHGLCMAAGKVESFAGDVYLSWDDRDQHNRNQPIVHGLVKFTSGVDDIKRSDMRTMTSTTRKYFNMVKSAAEANDFKRAGHLLLVQDNYVRHYAKKVGDWEGSLVGEAGRWVVALTILKEGLTLVATLGAVGLAAKGATLTETLTIGAKLTAMSTGVGATSAAAGAAATDGDIGKAARVGGGEGFSVGVESLTAGAAKVAAIGDIAKVSTRTQKAIVASKAIALDTGVGVGTASAQALVKGEDVGDAALGALVSSPIGAVGGGLVDKATNRRTTKAIGDAVVGSGSAAAAAAVTDGDVKKAAVFGGVKGGVASVASSGSTKAGEEGDSSAKPGQQPEAQTISGEFTAAPPKLTPTVGGEPSVIVDPSALGPRSAKPKADEQGGERLLDPPAEQYGPRRLEDEIESHYGMPVENQTRFAKAAEFLGLIIKVRPSNPAAVAKLREGHLAKPMEIKAKTITEIDLHLGFRAEDLGFVGYRKPDQPKRTEGMDDATWSRVEGRYEARSAEFASLASSMVQLQRPRDQQQGTSKERQYKVDQHGVIRVVDAKGGTEQAVTADHDLFEFRDVLSGRIVTDPDRLGAAMGLLKDDTLAVTHPANMNWDTEGAAPGTPPTPDLQQSRDVKDKIIQNHMTNEPLVVFRPGERPAIENAGIGKDY